MMENYEPVIEQTTEPSPESISLLDHVPFWRLVIFFLLGFLGLSLCATLYQKITALLINSGAISLDPKSIEYGVWNNFFAYAPIFITLFFALGMPLIKIIGRQFKNMKHVSEGFVFLLILLFGSSFISYIFMAIGKACGLDYTINANESAIRASIKAMPVASFCFVVLFAPFVEEMTYRVGFFGIISKYNKIIAYIISTLLFALIHFNFEFKDNNELYIELLNLPSYLFAGFTLSYAYGRNGSLVTSWIPHTLNNLLSFLANVGD